MNKKIAQAKPAKLPRVENESRYVPAVQKSSPQTMPSSLQKMSDGQLVAARERAIRNRSHGWGKAVADFPDEYYEIVREENQRAQASRRDEDLADAEKRRKIDKLNRDAACDRLSERNLRVALGEVEGLSPDEINEYFGK